MPRGWLKHKHRSVGRRAGRGGGSSRRTPKVTKEECSSDEKQGTSTRYFRPSSGKRQIPMPFDDYFFEEDDDNFYKCFEDEEYESGRDKNSSIQTGESIITAGYKKKDPSEVKQCPICCEDLPLIPLMKNCTHEPACQQCLREIFVKQAQENVSNYPLLCYHPSCRKPLHDAQLLLHNLVRSDKELQTHYRLKTLGKVYSDPKRKKLVYCPSESCEGVTAVTKHHRHVKCRQCDTPFHVMHEDVSHIITTIATMETSFDCDKVGTNNGVAHCPECNMLISKGNGCDHMRCFCGHDFSWEDARIKMKREFGNVGTARFAMAKDVSNL